MKVLDLLARNRSYRRFCQEVEVPLQDLHEMIEAARLCPSGRNAQPLKYLLVHTPEQCASVFPALSWAGYLRDWGGPVEGERPAAYVVVVHDTEISSQYFCDQGIVSMAILLTAVEKGFGGCIIASVNRPVLQSVLGLPARYEILLVIALGKPLEQVVIDPLLPGGDIKYWRDEHQVHHVPKRDLEELILPVFRNAP